MKRPTLERKRRSKGCTHVYKASKLLYMGKAKGSYKKSYQRCKTKVKINIGA